MPTFLRSLFGLSTENCEPGPIRPFYLVARPGFWGGMGSLNLIPSPLSWNYTPVPDPDLDATSFDLDWALISQDMRSAITTARVNVAI
jgi:hypothetical protein